MVVAGCRGCLVLGAGDYLGSFSPPHSVPSLRGGRVSTWRPMGLSNYL